VSNAVPDRRTTHRVRIRAAVDAIPGNRPRGSNPGAPAGGSGDGLIRLGQNEDAHGPFASALAAIVREAHSANRYPDPVSKAMRAEVAEFHGVPLETVFVSAGSSAVIHYLSLALLEPGDEIVYCDPTFPAYRAEALKMGARPVGVPLRADGGYDLDGLLAAVTDRTRLAYVTNPNNPTGVMVTRIEVADFLERLPEHVLPVIDEAYFEYVHAASYPDSIAEFFLPGDRSVVVLRTFSKAYGLAGLRVGYGICPPEVAEAITKVHVQFELTRVATVAAITSLRDPDDELEIRMGGVRAQRERLMAALVGHGLAPLASVANFVQVGVGDAASFAAGLAQHGVLVRALGSWGVPDSLRITIGDEAEMTALLDAFDAEVHRHPDR
jgi:histidinol-phosphate aminotransferase